MPIYPAMTPNQRDGLGINLNTDTLNPFSGLRMPGEPVSYIYQKVRMIFLQQTPLKCKQLIYS